MNTVDDLSNSTESTCHIKTDTLLSKYNIPINHIDYAYIDKCNDNKELGKILKILRSGEEGYYPDLANFTEERLNIIDPKNKLLRKTCPVKNRDTMAKEEVNEIESDLTNWLKSISTNDKELETRKVKEICYGDLPEIRENAVKYFNENTTNSVKKISSTDYESWDKYDPDTEILKLEIEEEKIKKSALEEEKKKQNEVKKNRKSVTFNKFATEAEAHFEAEREKEKGNECFKSEEYSEAFEHYTRSIKYKPSVAGYNNRAITAIKLRKHDEAVHDCDRALTIDPNNVKALMRKAQALEGLHNNKEALIVVERIISMEPNNPNAQELAHRLRKSTGVVLENKRLAIEEI